VQLLRRTLRHRAFEFLLHGRSELYHDEIAAFVTLIVEVPRGAMQRLVDVADHMLQPDEVVCLEIITLAGADRRSKRSDLRFCVGHGRGRHG